MINYGQVNGIDITGHGLLTAWAIGRAPGLQVWQGKDLLSPESDISDSGYRVAFLNSGANVAFLDRTGLRVFQIHPWAELWSLQNFESPYQLAIDANSDTRFVAVGDRSKMTVLDPNGEQVTSVEHVSDAAEGMSFLRHSELLAVSGKGGVIFFETEAWKKVAEIPLEEGYIRSVAGRSRSDFVACGGYSGKLYLVGLEGVRAMCDCVFQIQSVAVDKFAGTVIAVGTEDMIATDLRLEILADRKISGCSLLTVVEKGGVVAVGAGSSLGPTDGFYSTWLEPIPKR